MRARASIRSHANARGFVRRANTLHCGIRKSLISLRFNHPLREYHREKEREREGEGEWAGPSVRGSSFRAGIVLVPVFSHKCFRASTGPADKVQSGPDLDPSRGGGEPRETGSASVLCKFR
jgi:hypothetical protein